MTVGVILLIVLIVMSSLHLTYTVSAKPVSNIIAQHKKNAAIIKQLTITATGKSDKEIANILNNK